MSADSPRILVVDDEPGMREACRRVLAAEGYEVEVAEDGAAGLERCRARGDFAAALLDLKMPRMGGLELIEKIREFDRDIVLLVITAYATIDTAVEAIKRGAYGYIPKPFTPDELLLPVRNGLERQALAAEARRLRQEREKRLLEVALERSKCNTVIHCMTDGVLVVNIDGQVVLRNAAAARILPGCADLPTPAPLAAIECEPLRSVLAEVLQAHCGPMIVSKELHLGESTYMVNASPVLEPSGEGLGAVAVLRDITALKRLEVAKSMFVSMVAHEVKNPIAAVEGYLNVILSGVAGHDPERDRRMQERALVRTRTLRSLISELLSLAAIETGDFVIKRAALDLADVVAQAVETCRESAEAKRLALTLRHDDDAHQPVLADREAMLSVFANLIDNAIKYTPEGGHVDVHVQRNGMYVRVAVTDDGIGMAPDERDRAFDEFYRAKNELTAHVPGTGLGLALVKRLVEIHQGKISVQTAPGQGSTFAVRIPTAS